MIRYTIEEKTTESQPVKPSFDLKKHPVQDCHCIFCEQARAFGYPDKKRGSVSTQQGGEFPWDSPWSEPAKVGLILLGMIFWVVVALIFVSGMK